MKKYVSVCLLPTSAFEQEVYFVCADSLISTYIHIYVFIESDYLTNLHVLVSDTISESPELLQI